MNLKSTKALKDFNPILKHYVKLIVTTFHYILRLSIYSYIDRVVYAYKVDII